MSLRAWKRRSKSVLDDNAGAAPSEFAAWNVDWRLGGSPTGKSFRFVRACERARRGEAAWASERRFDSGARAVLGQKESYSAETGPGGCPRVF